MSDKELKRLLKEYNVFEELDNGKLRCTLTGHELPNRANDVKNYVTTKRFVNEWLIKKVMDKYEQYFENLGNNLFGCKLTMKTIARKGKDLEHHVNGQKFVKCLKIAQEKQAAEEAKQGGSDGEQEKEVEPDVEMQSDKSGSDEEAAPPPPKPKAGQKRKLNVKRKSGKVTKKV
ncbi:unnamed protein product [Bursaphelenchus xylophilus]|uniref:(pine wood nematode) hypothetical protein n=1 Tax=Bursaphelenchus xylophilus TaxID=6326 RepID=A0A1I7S0L0_BURXY|nr:unnamed protein product [Bursaphelenchus xylophilus]CAG9132320.1 unnamed protein product [Bursaphelenchus xylophilus]